MTSVEPQAPQASPAYADAPQPALLDQIVREGRFGNAAPEQARGRTLVRRFVEEVLRGSMAVAADTEAMLSHRIAEIDRLVSAQVAEIMHHADFQRLEATWRGLRYLLSQSDTGANLKIKILNVSKKELLRDLQRAPGYDQSALFKKVYEEEFGVFGGTPFGALLGDYAFGRSGEDVELLEKVSQVAAAAHAPFITGAACEMFNLDSYTQLDAPRSLTKIFDTSEYARWKSFRDSED